MNQNRTPAGIPTGGQFAASSRAEAAVDLPTDAPEGCCASCSGSGSGGDASTNGRCWDCLGTGHGHDPDADCGSGDDLGVWDDPDECAAIGAHLASVDDDGYCNHCGHDDPNPTSSRHGVSDAYPNGRCGACGCGVDAQGRCYQSDCSAFDASSPYADPDDEPATPMPEAAIVNDKHRTACLNFAATYATAPTDPTIRATGPTMTKAASEVQIGDRLANGKVVAWIEQESLGVAIYLDAESETEPTLRLFDTDPVLVHTDRVDWTDPDWFEAEVHRIVTDRDHNDPIDEAALRERLTRMNQPLNISPLDTYQTGRANGRAKVGDNVLSSSPMHGDDAYEVIGKMHTRVIVGADENGVQWAESREVDYVLKNLATGAQSTSGLTTPDWRRIPAPESAR